MLMSEIYDLIRDAIKEIAPGTLVCNDAIDPEIVEGFSIRELDGRSEKLCSNKDSVKTFSILLKGPRTDDNLDLGQQVYEGLKDKPNMFTFNKRTMDRSQLDQRLTTFVLQLKL